MAQVAVASRVPTSNRYRRVCLQRLLIGWETACHPSVGFSGLYLVVAYCIVYETRLSHSALPLVAAGSYYSWSLRLTPLAAVCVPSPRQMDTRGNGEIGLEEFKNGLRERWAVLDDSSGASRPVKARVARAEAIGPRLRRLVPLSLSDDTTHLRPAAVLALGSPV